MLPIRSLSVLFKFYGQFKKFRSKHLTRLDSGHKLWPTLCGLWFWCLFRSVLHVCHPMASLGPEPWPISQFSSQRLRYAAQGLISVCTARSEARKSQLMGSLLSWAPPCFLHSLPGIPWGSLLGFPAIYLGLYLRPPFWHVLPTTTAPALGPSAGMMEREKREQGVHPHTWDHYSSDQRGYFPSLRVLGIRGPLLPLSGHPFLTSQAWNRGFLLEFQLYWCLLLGFQLPWVRLADTGGGGIKKVNSRPIQRHPEF